MLLVEAHDYAFGTSSRSSKLVHGGFRYLKNRQFSVTRESVRERERLLRQAKYLVTPLYFLLPSLGFSRATRQVFRLGVTIYDLLAPKWAHGDLSPNQIHRICPQLTNDRLNAGFYYYDAEVDDARLVLRVIQEGIAAGGTALNYTGAETLLFQQNGQVAGALLRDNAPSGNGQTTEVFARVVINATGPWSDELRGQVDQPPRIRKQRGSHLIFPWAKLPLAQAITLLHPRDKRAMFVFPWEESLLSARRTLTTHVSWKCSTLNQQSQQMKSDISWRQSLTSSRTANLAGRMCFLPYPVCVRS